MSWWEEEIVVEIERLVVRGMDMTPEQTHQLSSQIEARWQRSLSEEDLLDNIERHRNSIVLTPDVKLSAYYDEQWLTQSLAQRIADVLHSHHLNKG